MYQLIMYVLYETIVIIIDLLFIFIDIMYTLSGRPETALMIISEIKKKKKKMYTHYDSRRLLCLDVGTIIRH